MILFVCKESDFMISPSFFSSGGESKFYKQSITSQLLPTPSSKKRRRKSFLVHCECLHIFNLVFWPILLMQAKIARCKLILWLLVDISNLKTHNVPKDGHFMFFFFLVHYYDPLLSNTSKTMA